MSQDELARLAGELDDVDVVHNQRKWPIPGTRAEKRAERAVAALVRDLRAVRAGLHRGLPVLALPVRAPAGPAAHALYLLYTPVIGLTFGLAVLALGIGVIAYVKKFFPDEVSVQQRHDGASAEVARRTRGRPARRGRRGHLDRPAFADQAHGGAPRPASSASGSGIAAIAPLVRNPWKGGARGRAVDHRLGADQRRDRLPAPRHRHPGRDLAGPPRGPGPGLDGDGVPVPGVRARGRGGTAGRAAPVRQPGDADPAAPGHAGHPAARPGGLHYGDYYAYSKICTHLGCPTSLYETQTQRILCPCHQSQFIATEYAKPVFGPAARPLPQLPITVNEEGYLVATGDFPDAIGPAFWELGADA